MKILFNRAFYVASKACALKNFPGLFDLQRQNALDIGTKYHTDKKCKEFVSSTASVEQQRMSEKVYDARFLCVPADGSTDKSTTEQGAVYVRHKGPNLRPTTVRSLLILLP